MKRLIPIEHIISVKCKYCDHKAVVMMAERKEGIKGALIERLVFLCPDHEAEELQMRQRQLEM